MDSEYIIEMLGITKEFPGVIANDNVTLRLRKGEIHAILGENGAGKSTLMSILFGIYEPDKGEIRINGKKVAIRNPNDATNLGIGMVHQHFRLIDVFTVTDNIILGAETTSLGFIKRKELTPEQYRRANKVMCVILVICYVVFIGVEYSNIAKTGEDVGGSMYRMIIYGVFAMLSFI